MGRSSISLAGNQELLSATFSIVGGGIGLVQTDYELEVIFRCCISVIAFMILAWWMMDYI